MMFRYLVTIGGSFSLLSPTMAADAIPTDLVEVDGVFKTIKEVVPTRPPTLDLGTIANVGGKTELDGVLAVATRLLRAGWRLP